jgi:hypothetical protein
MKERGIRPSQRITLSLVLFMLIMLVATGWGSHGLCWGCNTFSRELFFSPDPVFDIIPVRITALNKQLVSSVSDIFFG